MFRPLCLLVSGALAALCPWPEVCAQTAWDEARYAEWVANGNEAYAEAMALPLDAASRRRELLLASTEAKWRAREMLRAALVGGLLNDVWELASADYFNLSENLVIGLVELEQCDAAALLITQVRTEVEILPPDAGLVLDGLETRAQACPSASSRAPGFDLDRYRELLEEADHWAEESEAAGPAPADDLLESIWSRSRALELLRSAFFRSGSAAGVVDPVAAIMADYPPLIRDLARLGYCEAAQRRLVQWYNDARVLGVAPIAVAADVAAQMARCNLSQPAD